MDDNIDYPLHLFDENSVITSPENQRYESCIKIYGKAILPPMLTEASRNEMQTLKLKAIAIETRLQTQSKTVTPDSTESISRLNGDSANVNATVNAPIRPSSLKLTSQSLDQNNCPNLSVEQLMTNQTLEHRMAKDSSDNESRFSPLAVESLSDLRVGLERQKSYTVLDPSPGLLELLTNQQQCEKRKRKTWDLSRKEWCFETDSTEDYPTRKAQPEDEELNTSSQSEDPFDLVKLLEEQHDQQRKELAERQRREVLLLERKQAEIVALLKKNHVGDKEKKTLRRPKSVHEHRRSETLRSRPNSIHGALPVSGNHRRESGDFAGFRSNSAYDGFSRETNADDTDLDESFTEGIVGDIDSTGSQSSVHEVNVSDSKAASIADVQTIRDCHHKAASVINAGVRGYLTRRLLRTAHVQDLFRSLKDTIACMRKLRSANDLATADLELMAGLTRQTKSSWEAVYDMFITKPITEQMQIIANDRMRLRAQATRPTPSGDTPRSAAPLSTATVKSTSRRQAVMSASMPPMSASTTPRHFTRDCSKMTASLITNLPSTSRRSMPSK